ncbi:GlxA family transcriptional regulator [Dyella thiooxydans]|nr:GlxA family transcriptional regulator [Dyella thiooxydans]
MQILDLTGPVQVFASTNDACAASAHVPPYAWRMVATQPAHVTASSGIELGTQTLPTDNEPVDTLLIAGGPGVAAACQDVALLDWLRARSGQARRVGSVCTGAFLLATAGVLDGRRVTTHWSFCAELAHAFPQVRVESDPIFVRDGEIWTSAGVTSGIDLALAMVEEDLGRDIALAVARHLVVYLKRPGGQGQYSAALSLQVAEDCFGDLHDWMAAHLAYDLSLPRLAEQAAMSSRSFSRRYREATGMTPARAVEHLRIDEARRLLLETRLPMKRIAQRCGFGSEETLRRSFMRLLKVTPNDYRSRFGTTL